MAERGGGGSREGETEKEESSEDLLDSLGGIVGGTDVLEVEDVKLLDANEDCFLRKGILSLAVEVLAPLEERG
jgi:hypothetical protein